MNVDIVASKDVITRGDDCSVSCIGFASDALPEVQTPVLAANSHEGVSINYAPVPKKKADSIDGHWYVLRTTYGREKKAYEFITNKGVTAFCPMINTVKIVNGKRKTVKESLIPNIFFAYGTEKEIRSFVFDNVNLPYLRFYYDRFRVGGKIEKKPLIIPENQIETLRIICQADSTDVIISNGELPKFQTGQLVRVVDGQFKGVIGRVARYQGQQRVGIFINGLMTVATAYIPSAFVAVL